MYQLHPIKNCWTKGYSDLQTNTLVKCFSACVSFDLWSFISVTLKESCLKLCCTETYLFEITCLLHYLKSKRVSLNELLEHSTCIVNSYFERTLNPFSKVATSKINYVQPNFGFWCQTCRFSRCCHTTMTVH